MLRVFLLTSAGGPTGAATLARTALAALPDFPHESAVADLRHAFDFAGLARLRDRIRAFGPDVLHAVGPGAVRAAALLTLPRIGLKPFPRLVVGGCDAPDGWLARRGLARADTVLAYTPGQEQRYAGFVKAERVWRVPVGVAVPGDKSRGRNGSGTPPLVEGRSVAQQPGGESSLPESTPLPAGELSLTAPTSPQRGEVFQNRPGGPTSPNHGNKTTIAAVGNFDRDSGLRTAVWAFDLLKYVAPDLELLLIGDGPGRAAVDEFGRALGFDDYRVRFAGHTEDVPRLLASAAVTWVTHARGGAVVALESLSVGTPVIALRTADTESVVSDGETGRLVPFGDVAALASVTAGLLNQSGELCRLGEAGGQTVAERYTPGRLAEATAVAYVGKQ